MKVSLVLSLFLLLSFVSAEGEAGWESINPADPDGYLDEMLIGLGTDLSSDDVVGGGGNPVSGVSDPIIQWINESLGTDWGFIYFYTITLLFVSLFVPSIIGFLLLSYVAYFVGKAWDVGNLFLIMLLAGLFGALIFWKFTHKSERVKSIRNIIKWIIILMVLGLIAFVGLSLAGIVIII